jgi:hypothetical protein
VAQLDILFQNCVEKKRKPQRTSVTTVSIVKEIRIVELLATLQKRYSLIHLNTTDPNDPNEVNFTHVCSYALRNEVHKSVHWDSRGNIFKIMSVKSIT